MGKKKDYGTGVPEYSIQALARCLLPEIQKYYESEEGRKAFEEWKAKQAKNQGIEKNKSDK
ncbi:MAG: hypothetical protein GX800_00095 [Clostridiaceae bacterium]|jgi:hypothetical protein|nr:hypothetical protein [Clostridiaceae bacterium]